mgnify:CR=1 FL=1
MKVNGKMKIAMVVAAMFFISHGYTTRYGYSFSLARKWRKRIPTLDDEIQTGGILAHSALGCLSRRCPRCCPRNLHSGVSLIWAVQGEGFSGATSREKLVGSLDLQDSNQ